MFILYILFKSVSSLISFNAELRTIKGKEVLNHSNCLYFFPEYLTETASGFMDKIVRIITDKHNICF